MNKKQKNTEEILNYASHGIAAIASIFGIIVLIINSSKQEWGLFSAIVYGSSLIILYTSSTLYHMATNQKIKRLEIKIRVAQNVGKA